ncbi:hypothetical protein DFAR_310010 [Desulfarculales bacterium]
MDAEYPRFPKSDPLSLSEGFCGGGARPASRVSGADGCRALACALAVRERVYQSLEGMEKFLVVSRRLVDARLSRED